MGEGSVWGMDSHGGWIRMGDGFVWGMQEGHGWNIEELEIWSTLVSE